MAILSAVWTVIDRIYLSDHNIFVCALLLFENLFFFCAELKFAFIDLCDRIRLVCVFDFVSLVDYILMILNSNYFYLLTT